MDYSRSKQSKTGVSEISICRCYELFVRRKQSNLKSFVDSYKFKKILKQALKSGFFQAHFQS